MINLVNLVHFILLPLFVLLYRLNELFMNLLLAHNSWLSIVELTLMMKVNESLSKIRSMPSDVFYRLLIPYPFLLPGCWYSTTQEQIYLYIYTYIYMYIYTYIYIYIYIYIYMYIIPGLIATVQAYPHAADLTATLLQCIPTTSTFLIKYIYIYIYSNIPEFSFFIWSQM
jgi:hypothetical protein